VSTFDFDVVIIGSGFGGSEAALPLVERGYRVAVLEAGRQFADHEGPQLIVSAVNTFAMLGLGFATTLEPGRTAAQQFVPMPAFSRTERSRAPRRTCEFHCLATY